MQRTGQTNVLVALTLTTLVGFAAFAIDLSAARMSRAQLGNAAEAAAHAGAAKLDGSVEGMVAARNAALALAIENSAEGTPVVLDANTANAADGDVVLGFWSGTAFVPSTDPALVTSVQVIGARDDLRSTFAKVAFEVDALSASDYAIAQAGGPAESPCPMPISLADCEVEAVKDSCNLDMVLNSDRLDNGAWANKGGKQANADDIRDALDTAQCTQASNIGETVTLNNGAINSALKALAKAVNASPNTWDDATMGIQPDAITGSEVTRGKVLYGQIMIFHDPTNCDGTKYNGNHDILGYATAVVYDVATGADKSVAMRIACDEAPAQGGGAYFGTTVPPRFVR